MHGCEAQADRAQCGVPTTIPEKGPTVWPSTASAGSVWTQWQGKPVSQYCCEGASQVVRWKRICLPSRRHGFDSCVSKILWRRKWQPTPVFLPGESHGQRSLVGYRPWGHKSQTRLSNYTTIMLLWRQLWPVDSLKGLKEPQGSTITLWELGDAPSRMPFQGSPHFHLSPKTSPEDLLGSSPSLSYLKSSVRKVSLRIVWKRARVQRIVIIKT